MDDQEAQAGHLPLGSAANATEQIKQLFDNHNRTLLSFLRARLRSEAEARDVAQEAYVKLLELDNINVISFQRAYLFRIAANLAVDRLRQPAVRDTTASESFLAAISDDRDPERTVIAREELGLVREALLGLPAPCRNAFIWHVFEGQSTVQIASRLNLSDRMIRLYIARALAKCRASVSGSGALIAGVRR